MNLGRGLLVVALLAASPLASRVAWAQKWEFGGGVGGGFYTSHTVERADGNADTKIKPGIVGSVWVGSNNPGRWGGELRYDYQRGALSLSGNGTSVDFNAESHQMHYDLLWHTRNEGAAVRPFLAIGGGGKIYRGTGTETIVQPLSKYALLTKTSEILGMVSVGAGVKVKMGDRWQLRFDVHDYMSPFPKQVITPNVGSKVGNGFGGWMHDIVPMFGIVYTSAR